MTRRATALALAATGGYGVLQWLGRTAGSTASERAERLPGDEIVSRPAIVTNHAITIEAPPSAVWPWLVQMGWHRAGWYTARWVDRLLFPANGPSAEWIVPELQGTAVGDFVPDGPPEAECGFVVAALDAEHALVLHSRSHLPPKWRAGGATMSWSWTFRLQSRGNTRCRLLVRSRVTLAPRWVAAAYRATLAPADFVMSQQMLRGIKARAEDPARRSAVR